MKTLDRVAIVLSIALLLLLSFVLGSEVGKRTARQPLNKSELIIFSSIKYTTLEN